jgi:glycosyltransferase involved in cell wall biosynthesis
MKPGFRIDQVLAGFADGDAISHAALAMRGVFRAWGAASDIFADMQHVSPTMAAECRPLDAFKGEPGHIVAHHYSIGSPAMDVFIGAPCRKVLVYHNITPPHYFEGFDDRVAAQLRTALQRLRATADLCDAVWAVSEFNAAELRGMGVSNAKVFPLLFAPGPLDVAPDPEVLKRFAVKLTTILFVGRIVPNKRVGELIEAFSFYSKTINRYSRLVIVGSDRSCPRYYAMLRMLVGDHDLPNACFEGFASPGGLPAYYKSADLFVTASEHEGYCLPLLEAMHMKVPVMARNAGGMPEALGGAGILYEGLDAPQLAALMHRALSDPALRADVLAGQERRMAEVRKRNVEKELQGLMEGLVSS